MKQEWEITEPRGFWVSSRNVSPDGKLLALAGENRIILYDALTGKPVQPPTAHTGGVEWVAFSPDGKTVNTAGGGEVFSWATNGERKKLTELPELSRGWIPSGVGGQHLVLVSKKEAGKETELIGWDQEVGRVSWRLPLPGAEPTYVFSQDGKRVVSVEWDDKWQEWQARAFDGPAGKTVDSWPVPYLPSKLVTQEHISELERYSHMNGYGQPQGGMGGGGGRKGGPQNGRGGGGPDNSNRFRQLASLMDLSTRDGPRWSHPLALSGDGSTIFVGGAKIWALDPISGKRKARIDPGQISTHFPSEGSLAASHDGSRLAIADQQALRVFDVQNEKQLIEFNGAFSSAHIQFNRQANCLAVWSGRGPIVSIYSLDSTVKPRQLDGGLSAPMSAAFNSDGKNLAVGYRDGTTLIWDLATK